MLVMWYRQSDERTLFQGVHHMAKEVKMLWERVEEIGEREDMKGVSKGFGYGVRQGSGLGSTSIRELLAENRFVDAVLGFLKVGKVEAGLQQCEILVRAGGQG